MSCSACKENNHVLCKIFVCPVLRKELGKRTGYISKSKRVVEVKNGEIIRDWPSSRKAAKDLYISYQTVSDYCNNKVESPMFNLMWEDDYFDEVLEPFKWEHKKRKEKKK